MNTENWDVVIAVNELVYWVMQGGFDGHMDVTVDVTVDNIVAAPVHLTMVELVNWDADEVPSLPTVSQYLDAVGR